MQDVGLLSTLQVGIHTSITTAFWLDASDTSSYTLSFNNVTAITDKSSNCPNYKRTKHTPKDYPQIQTHITQYSLVAPEDFTTATEEAVVSRGNHWAIGVFQWNTINDTQDISECGE